MRCRTRHEHPRLRRGRGLPPGRHGVRVVLREVPEEHEELLPDRPVGAVVGHLLHGGRHGNEHAHVHRRAGVGLRGQLDVSPTGRRVRDRPADRQHAVPAAVLPRGHGHLVPVAAATIRFVGQLDLGRLVPRHALARRRHPPLRHGTGHLDRDGRARQHRRARAGHGDDHLHGARRIGRGDLDRRGADVHLHRRRADRLLRSALADPRRMERSDSARLGGR